MGLTDVRQVEWDNVVEAIETCYELGWTDGLPVVPPRLERVETFVHYVQRSPDEVLGSLPERRREITVGNLVSMHHIVPHSASAGRCFQVWVACSKA
jgi:hypothetical protein